jgi:hypothetical protein
MKTIIRHIYLPGRFPEFAVNKSGEVVYRISPRKPWKKSIDVFATRDALLAAKRLNHAGRNTK